MIAVSERTRRLFNRPRRMVAVEQIVIRVDFHDWAWFCVQPVTSDELMQGCDTLLMIGSTFPRPVVIEFHAGSSTPPLLFRNSFRQAEPMQQRGSNRGAALRQFRAAYIASLLPRRE